MTDPFFSIVEEVRDAGLHPRRLRLPAIYIRRLAWPVIRGWFYSIVKHINWENGQISEHIATIKSEYDETLQRLTAECEQLREQAQADRRQAAAALQEATADRQTIGAVRHQLETLQTTLAAYMMDRTFFERNIRTEIMAISNIVDHYRELTEKVLENPWDETRIVAGQASPHPLARSPTDSDSSETSAALHEARLEHH